MKIVIAPDSFKGSLNALDVSRSIEKGIKKVFPQAETVLIPMADGGEGTMETLVTTTGGYKKKVTVTGPLGIAVDAEYGVLGDSEICVIEVASAAGIDLVPKEQLNPLIATTYGVGELIRAALDDGFRKFIIGLGGSATNDGGAGILQALGLKLLDENGFSLNVGGGELSKLHTIDRKSFDKRVSESTFLIASDVQNPLIGLEGASSVFGPQKGATPEMVKQLDSSLAHFADEIEKVTNIHIHDLPGAGAAGGIGGAFRSFFPSEVKRGIDIVIEYTKLEQALNGADLLITGEGRIDSQTVFGKTPMGVAQVGKRQNVPTVVLAGSVGDGIDELYQFGIISVMSILNGPLTLSEAMEQTADLLAYSAEQIIRLFYKRNL